MHLAHSLGVETTYSHGKLGAILGATGVYVVAVLMLRPASGDSILIAVIVPVLITAWSFGARAALLASLLAIMLNVFFVTIVGDVGMAAWLLGGGALARGAALTGAALVIGHLRDVRERLDHELVERDKRHDAHRFLAEIATNMAEGVYLIRDSDGVIVYANQRFEEMFGYGAGELIGKDASVLNAPGEKNPEEVAREIMETLRATGSWRGEIWNVKKDGTPFWSRASVSTFAHHEHGTVCVSVHQDITDQKLAEEALRESVERYRALFESAPVGIAITEARGTIVRTNPALEKMLGRTGEELCGSRLRDFRPDGLEAPSNHVSARLSGGETETLRYERQLLHSSGEVVWTRITATSAPVHAGQPERVFRIFEDVTEEKRAEKALRESEERYRALFDSAPVGIAISRKGGVIVDTNSALQQMLGRSREELVGASLTDFRLGGRSESGTNVFDRLANGEIETVRFVRELVHRNGTIVWADITATAVPSQTGRVEYVFRMIEDITERKEAERALQEAEAERLDRTRHLASIGALAAGVAHEINNPLNSVMGFTQLVLGEEALSNQARSDLEMVYAESQRAAKIVQNLLSFARKREPERRPVDVRSVVERACHLKEYDLRKHAIELRTHFPEELSLVLGDEQQLTEVILNLLTNAEQAIASTGRPGVVTVTCGASGGLVEIKVANDGPGIPPEILGRIFEPFFTTKEVGGGTGLGLSMCQGIIREHDGELWAESTLGGDTTFLITLPVPLTPLTPSTTPEAEPAHPAVASMRILVVDDEPSARDLIARALAKDNHTIEQASDGDDAWRQIRSTSYDCVIADLRMPGSSGQELYRLVEESDPDLAARFIFITGDTMSPDTNTFLSSVAADSLMKPIDITELRRRVAELHEVGKATDGSGHEPSVAEGAGTQGPDHEEGAP